MIRCVKPESKETTYTSPRATIATSAAFGATTISVASRLKFTL
ncbi:Uncharacterised protein [Vibrio cholerae]|nr:Uncharacterised protein [Vibrio cholerae]CSB87603.1 Uncharacterised protein [Vibrio cholerae]CSI55944.1 Uncharacterised protein [Vibrio cholerae]